MPLQTVLDGNGAPIQAYIPGNEVVEDSSSVIAAIGVSQIAIAAPAAPAQRSGWLLANTGAGAMYVNDLGAPASAVPAPGVASFKLSPGQSIGTLPGCTFPVPLTQAAINIAGATLNDPFLVRSW